MLVNRKIFYNKILRFIVSPEDFSEKLRNAAIGCLSKTMPNLSKLVSETDYFTGTIRVGNKQKQYEKGFATPDQVYVLVDFTSKQEDHVEDLGPYLQSMYDRLMRAQGFIS